MASVLLLLFVLLLLILFICLLIFVDIINIYEIFLCIYLHIYHSFRNPRRTRMTSSHVRSTNSSTTRQLPGSQRSTGSTPNQVLNNDISNLRESDLQNLFGNINQQQLMQLLGGGMSSLANLLGPGSGGSGGSGGSHGSSGGSGNYSSSTARTSSTTTPATATTTPTPAPTPAQDASQAGSGSESSGTTPASGSVVPIQLSDLQNILSGISVPPDASGTPQGAGGPELGHDGRGLAAHPYQRELRECPQALPARHRRRAATHRAAAWHGHLPAIPAGRQLVQQRPAVRPVGPPSSTSSAWEKTPSSLPPPATWKGSLRWVRCW